MQMKRDIFSFSFKGNLLLLFFTTRVNSIRGHSSSLLVLRTVSEEMRLF